MPFSALYRLTRPWAALLALMFAIGCSNSNISEALPIDDFISTPKNFSGNSYALTARIDRQMGFEEGVGKIVLTRTIEDVESFIPLFVGVDIQGFNPSPGQLYEFTVRVDGNGLLNLVDYAKL